MSAYNGIGTRDTDLNDYYQREGRKVSQYGTESDDRSLTTYSGSGELNSSTLSLRSQSSVASAPACFASRKKNATGCQCTLSWC